MKIFIIGLPKSGRTTMAKALSEKEGSHYIDASSWVKHTFRDIKDNEPAPTYQDEFHSYLSDRLKINPDLYVDNVKQSIQSSLLKAPISSLYEEQTFIIDGLNSPHDLVKLFNYNEDYMVFVNRTDNDAEYRDHESIGVSVIRDYCYWMSSAGLLPKSRWIEYNFKMPGEESDHVKILGSKNSVFIVKSINRAISHFKSIMI